MKRIRFAILASLPLTLTGCFVQSLYPCYTEENRIDVPGVAGDWREADDEEGAKPAWQFLADGEVITQQDGVASMLESVYFRVGDHVFVDWTAGDPGESDCVNMYWLTHVRPTHSVLKVDLDGDTLVLTPLDIAWTAKTLAESPPPLASLPTDDEQRPLIVASPQDWQTFLKTHAENPEAFKPQAALELVRVQGGDSEE